MDELGNVIIKARVTFALRGYGDLTLTENALYWNKSATSYLAFGVLNAATENHAFIPLSDIASVSTYTYFPGGGMLVTDKHGKEYKFSFKRKKDFDTVYNYIKEKG